MNTRGLQPVPTRNLAVGPNQLKFENPHGLLSESLYVVGLSDRPLCLRFNYFFEMSLLF